MFSNKKYFKTQPQLYSQQLYSRIPLIGIS
jgi:hypothetical protein